MQFSLKRVAQRGRCRLLFLFGVKHVTSLYTRSFSSEDNHPGRSDYTFEARAGRRQPEPSPSPRSKGGGPLLVKTLNSELH